LDFGLSYSKDLFPNCELADTLVWIFIHRKYINGSLSAIASSMIANRTKKRDLKIRKVFGTFVKQPFEIYFDRKG
jgi:hypothetical protein